VKGANTINLVGMTENHINIGGAKLGKVTLKSNFDKA